MRSRTKKAIITALCCSMLAGGALAVILASAEPNNWLAIQYEDKTTSAFCGETVSVDDVLPVYPDKVEKILYEVTAPDGSHVALSNGDFIVEQEGVYDVIISLSGYDNSSYSESYTISATKSPAPILKQAPVIPVAFMERYNPNVTDVSKIKPAYKYTAPEAVFVDYNSATPTEVDYSVYLTDKYGKDVLITDTFSPVVDVHQDKITLKYVAKSSVTNQSCEIEYQVPVLKASQRDQNGKYVYEYDKMFVTSGGVSSSKVTDIGATFTGTGDYSLTYYNKLKSNFSVLLKSSTVVKFVSATVRITDIKNPEEFVTIEILQDLGGSSIVSVNGEAGVTAQGSLTNENGLALMFDKKFNTVVDATMNTITKLTTTAKGQPFDGFSSGYVTISIEVNGGTTDSTISVLSLNGQMFADTGKETDLQDKISPTCESMQEMNRKNNIGDTLIVSEVNAYDIIDANLVSTVTVRAPDGTFATSTDNVVLNKVDASRTYNIVLNTLGNYMISYNTQDISGNGAKRDMIYTIYVFDGVTPTISVPNLMASNVYAGTSLTVPVMEFSDNVTTNENIVTLITITLPDDSYQIVESGTQFTFTIPGTYFVRYTVMDEAFNFASIEQKITCWEAQ